MFRAALGNKILNKKMQPNKSQLAYTKQGLRNLAIKRCDYIGEKLTTLDETGYDQSLLQPGFEIPGGLAAALPLQSTKSLFKTL